MTVPVLTSNQMAGHARGSDGETRVGGPRRACRRVSLRLELTFLLRCVGLTLITVVLALRRKPEDLAHLTPEALKRLCLEGWTEEETR